MNSSTVVAKGIALNFVGHLGRIARSAALVFLPRHYGLESMGVLLTIWSCVQISALLAGLGFERSLPRFLPAAEQDERVRFVAASLLMSAGASVLVGIALAIAIPFLFAIPADQRFLVQATAFLATPVFTVTTVMLHAIRATKHVGPLVLARSIAEPVTFLAAGLAFAAFTRHTNALFVAQLVSVFIPAVIATVFLSKHFSLVAIGHAMTDAASLPCKKLLRFSISLGLAEAGRLALFRMDVPMVGMLLRDAKLTGAYAIAREVVTFLSKIQQGFDSILAPVSAELQQKKRALELSKLAAMSVRFSLALSLPFALLLAISGDIVLPLFGIPTGLVTVALAVLACGRAFDCVTAPAAVILAMSGYSRALLFNTVVALVVCTAGFAVFIPHWGTTGAAVATTTGLVIFNTACFVQLRRWEHIHIFRIGIVRGLGVGAISALLLLLLRPWLNQSASENVTMVILLFVAWFLQYVLVFAMLGLKPDERRSAMRKLRLRFRRRASNT